MVAGCAGITRCLLVFAGDLQAVMFLEAQCGRSPFLGVMSLGTPLAFAFAR